MSYLDNPEQTDENLTTLKDLKASQKNVLLIDDEEDLTTITSRLLGRFCKVRVENDPSSALRELMFNQPDLILLDINMPEVNGIQVLEQLKSLFFKKAVQPKIVMLTSNHTSDIVKKALLKGADGYLIKTLEPEDLCARVRDYLGIPQPEIGDEEPGSDDPQDFLDSL